MKNKYLIIILIVLLGIIISSVYLLTSNPFDDKLSAMIKEDNKSSFLGKLKSLFAEKSPKIMHYKAYDYNIVTESYMGEGIQTCHVWNNDTVPGEKIGDEECLKPIVKYRQINGSMALDKSWIEFLDVLGIDGNYYSIIFNYTEQNYNCTAPSRELGEGYVTCDSGNMNNKGKFFDGNGDSYCTPGETCLVIKADDMRIDSCNNKGSYFECSNKGKNQEEVNSGKVELKHFRAEKTNTPKIKIKDK